MKKVISVILAAAMALSAAFALSGCGSSNFPVEVANIKIETEPVSIAVLDDCTADIISYIGYETRIVGRSDEVDQKGLSVAPSFGEADSPDVEAIKKSGATLVFARDSIRTDVMEELEKAGVQVIRMSTAETPKQLEVNYTTIGKVLGGSSLGYGRGADGYNRLLENLEDIGKEPKDNAKTLDTVCYLYYDNDRLKLMTSGTYGDMLLGYTGAVNVAVNIDENRVDVNTLKIANPNYIFYADKATLDAIKSDSVLSKLKAVKDNKTLKISTKEMTRQGNTALETLQKMVDFIYGTDKDSKSTKETTSKDKDKDKNKSETEAAQDSTAAADSSESGESVAADYNVTIDDKTELKKSEQNDTIKAMQQRLFDLGYIDDPENVTGYYGDMTEQAVKAFQEKASLEASGTADNKTVKAIFAKDAPKAKNDAEATTAPAENAEE